MHAARRHRVSLYQYKRWEADIDKPPRVEVGPLERHERCFLTRRRYGMSLKQLAEELGVSPWWATQMEQGKVPPDKLEKHWEGVFSSAT